MSEAKSNPNHHECVKKAVTYDSNGKVIDCLFCRIQRRQEPGVIVYENDEFVVFKTIAPATLYGHLLITPRDHIKNLSVLSGPKDAQLIKRMIEIGRISLGDRYASTAQYSFHCPPWNSIDHLHLHAIANPSQMNFFNSMKYYIGTFWCRSADDVISQLQELPDIKRDSISISNPIEYKK